MPAPSLITSFTPSLVAAMDLGDAARQHTWSIASMAQGTPDAMSACPATDMNSDITDALQEDDFVLELSTTGSEDEPSMLDTPGYRYWLGKRWDAFQSEFAPCPDEVV